MLSVLAFLFVLSALIIAHEFGHFIVAKRCGVRVEIFSIGFGPKLIAKKVGDTEYRISALPFGGYVKMAGETYEDEIKGERWEFLSKPVGKRTLIVIAGCIMNFLLAFIIYFVFSFTFGIPGSTTEVGALLDDYPAQRAGIMIGDSIISIDGVATENWQDMTRIIHKSDGKLLRIRLERDAKALNFKIKPKLKEEKDVFGKGVSYYLIGISPVILKGSIGKSFFIAGKQVIIITGMLYKAFYFMITGKISFKEVGGPILIYTLTSKAAQQGIVALFGFLALISINLAVINLFPIPFLDGGHIILLGIEKIRRKPITPKVQEILNKIGVSFLIAVMVLVSFNDLRRLDIIKKIITLFKK